MGQATQEQTDNVWRYRSGDYRILCQLQGDVFVVLVLEVGHRKDNYK
jgi:mRNA interferase RelE/StbE